MYTSPSYYGGGGQLDEESDWRMRGNHSSSSDPAEPELELELCALRLRLENKIKKGSYKFFKNFFIHHSLTYGTTSIQYRSSESIRPKTPRVHPRKLSIYFTSPYLTSPPSVPLK